MRVLALMLVVGCSSAWAQAQCSIINGTVNGNTYPFVACPVVMPDGGTSLQVSQGDPLPDGGFWRVSVVNFPASQAVTGTFFQATQPVSLASAPTTAVTGTFWQATQPVSIASMPSTPVTGTFFQATQPVSLATAPALVASSAVIGHVINDASSAVIGHVIADTGSTTAVTGNVAVTQAAGSVSGSNPCSNPTATILGVSVATSGTASVQLVALSGSTKIYVCSLNVTGVSGTTPTFKLTYGTGTACASGTTGIVGPFTTTANVNFLFTGPTFAVTPAGQALCYIQTGTSPVSTVNLTYVQL